MHRNRTELNQAASPTASSIPEGIGVTDPAARYPSATHRSIDRLDLRPVVSQRPHRDLPRPVAFFEPVDVPAVECVQKTIAVASGDMEREYVGLHERAGSVTVEVDARVADAVLGRAEALPKRRQCVIDERFDRHRLGAVVP